MCARCLLVDQNKKQVLLDYQLSMHEEHLRPFYECFTSIDTDEDGEINEVSGQYKLCYWHLAGLHVDIVFRFAN